MTPSGVEQEFLTVARPTTKVVTETMTPSGVEQTTLPQATLSPALVTETMTPSGVEQVCVRVRPPRWSA